MNTVTRFFRPSARSGEFRAAIVHAVAEYGRTSCGISYAPSEARNGRYRWTHHWADQHRGRLTCATCRKKAGLPPLPANYRHEDY